MDIYTCMYNQEKGALSPFSLRTGTVDYSTEGEWQTKHHLRRHSH